MRCAYRNASCSCIIADLPSAKDNTGDPVNSARAVRRRVYSPGETLYLQGDECHGVYCVQSGLVAMRRSDEEGQSALLRLARKGDVLGYHALLGRHLHRNAAEVLTTSRVCIVERSHFAHWFERSPVVRNALLQLAMTDMDRSEEACASLLIGDMRSRLMRLLNRIHEDEGGEHGASWFTVDLPIPRKDLAALLGATPESLSRLINRLGKEGSVRFDGRRVIVTIDRRRVLHSHRHASANPLLYSSLEQREFHALKRSACTPMRGQPLEPIDTG